MTQVTAELETMVEARLTYTADRAPNYPKVY